MKSTENSTTIFIIYAKEFIKSVYPEVVENIPSILFESTDIKKLHKKASNFAEFTSELIIEPFLNFNFKSPSGIYFAVKEI